MNIAGCLSLKASCMYIILSWISSRSFFTHACLISNVAACNKIHAWVKLCLEGMALVTNIFHSFNIKFCCTFDVSAFDACSISV